MDFLFHTVLLLPVQARAQQAEAQAVQVAELHQLLAQAPAVSNTVAGRGRQLS